MIDLATATALRDAAKSAYERALLAQSYSRPNGASVTRQALGELEAAYIRWQRTVDQLTDAAAGYNPPSVATWD